MLVSGVWQSDSMILLNILLNFGNNLNGKRTDCTLNSTGLNDLKLQSMNIYLEKKVKFEFSICI